MILRRLTFNNILTYYGEQSMDLPASDDSVLGIVVGPNNSGKTSIIRALKFWFYGEDGLNISRKSIIDSLRVHKQTGTKVNIGVAARLKFSDNKTLTIWRQITALGAIGIEGME